MTTPELVTFTVEARIPGSPKERLEWLQRCFEYFHPTLDAKVIHQGEAVKTAPALPTHAEVPPPAPDLSSLD